DPLCLRYARVGDGRGAFPKQSRYNRDVDRRPESEIVRFRLFCVSERNYPMHTSSQLSHPADNIFSTEPLGAIYTPDNTIFRVWAPTAGKVTLKLYDSPSGGRPRLLSMSRHRDGTWSTMLLGDWRGIYYTYSASGRDPRFDLARELIDPYARAVTAHN